MNKKIKIFLIIFVLITLGFIFYSNRIKIKELFFENKVELPNEISRNEINSSGADLEEDNSNENVEVILESPKQDDKNEIVPNPPSQTKTEINLKVPFIIQSPDQKWEGIYKEACEEASLLMVYGFLENKDITVDFAMTQIAEMINWGNENITESEDLTADQTLELARGFYKLSGEVVKLNSIDDIKKIVSGGSPVILPALGRELKNPNFKVPGPIYHMLVVKGFTKDGLIITNDPGTRKGKDYLYNPEILFNAIADWDIDMQSPNANKKVGIVLR